MAQTQIVQKRVKILGKWYKRGDGEKAPQVILASHENREINLVYWGKTIPAAPKDHIFLVSVTVDENHKIPEYTLIKEKGIKGPAFMKDLNNDFSPPAEKEETYEIEISEAEINAYAEFEENAANKKRSAKTPILSTAVNHTPAAIVKLDDNPIEFSGEGLALPPEDEILQFIQRYEFVKKSIVDKSDFQKVGNKHFMKKSGFRKFIAPFRLSVQMIDRIETVRKGAIEFEVRVRVSSQTGQFCEGIGVCTQDEKNRTGQYLRSAHDTYATAYTRAVNRAISDLVAFGEVSYEEVEG